MLKYKKKYLPLFISISDELLVAKELAIQLPSISFVDGNSWPSNIPPARDSIVECKSPIVYIWDRQIRPNLPCKALDSGNFLGPTSGVVVQFIRPSIQNGFLLSGDLSTAYETGDIAMRNFVELVFSTIIGLNCCTLRSIEIASSKTLIENVSEYVVGPGALFASKNGQIFKHMAGESYYVCNNLPL